MAGARQDENWAQTASVMAMLLNVNRFKRSDKVWTPADFPLRPAPAAAIPKVGIGVLKSVFCGKSDHRGTETQRGR